MGCGKSSSKREVYRNTILPQETRNISNKQPNPAPKAVRERRTKNPTKLAEGKKSVKNTNTWRLNHTLLNNQEITEETKEEIKKYLETNDNENTTTQNLWDVAKAVLRGKFIAMKSYLKKQETSQINNLTFHLKQLEK